MRPLVQRPPFDGLIATLGVALFLALLELASSATATQRAPSPVGTRKRPDLRRVPDAPLVVALRARRRWSRRGLYSSTQPHAVRPGHARDDVATRRSPGCSAYRSTASTCFAWGVGGALSGAAAALLAPAFGGLTPFAQTTFALRALAGAVIGGLDSIWGAILGSLHRRRRRVRSCRARTTAVNGAETLRPRARAGHPAGPPAGAPREPRVRA